MIEASSSANRFKESDKLMLITNKRQTVRTRVKESRETGRNTMGVKLMDLRNGEKLQAIAPVVSQAEEEAQTAEESVEKS
jgi:DNA gyrase subunit A